MKNLLPMLLAAFLVVSMLTAAEPPPAFSPFGIGACHIHNRSAADHARWMPQMVEIGIRHHRTVQTGWGSVEPEPGKWTWDTLDQSMAYLDKLGVKYGGFLIGNPKWSNKDGKGGLPVNNLEGWGRYVGEVVKHCKGRITYWEVWNEPPNGTAKDQTAADYAKIVMTAYKAAKAADPDCKIGIAAKSVAINYLDQAIAAGAKGHFDFVTLHPYETGGCVITHPGTEPVYLQIKPTLRKMLAARDPDKVDCPLIFTELGFAAAGQYSRKIGGFNEVQVQAQALVKYYVMGIAQGIDCIQWFEGRDGDSGPLGLLDGKGVPRPAYTAMAHSIKQLGPHPKFLGWTMLNDRHYAFYFEGAKGPVLATWASSLKPDRIVFGDRVRILDPLTGETTQSHQHELTINPILVLDMPAKWLDQAKHNRDKPYPWDGDYTDAKSVLVTFGEKNVEKGLHTKSSATVAQDVLAYGGSARVGSVPGGNVYIVDPNFLAYTSTPIEISVVVRRNAKNDPAKLTLTYESTSGYKKAEPFEIPDNKNWHTAKWIINDAQFVNMWAYNFTLNSGSYVIQSVTVTKGEK